MIRKKRFAFLTGLTVLAVLNPLKAQQKGYDTPAVALEKLSALASAHTDVCRMQELTVTPGGNKMVLIEIGDEVKAKTKTKPAVLVIADLSGTRPLAVEGALQLAEYLLAHKESYADRSWYLIPLGNPDAAARYFVKPLIEDARNARPYNDDMDDRTDEDGPEDLNNDGVITQMRVKDPEGTWVADTEEPRLMRKPDPKKGEIGMYKLYTEGIDNDGDGQYNEDGSGGTNPAINFPPLFRYFTPGAGSYPGSTPESFAVMDFVFGHPEIAMIYSIDRSNLCYSPFRTNRKSSAATDKLKIPERRAAMLGADPEKEYSMKEVIAMLQARFQSPDIDESMVAAFLGLGAVVNPLEEDIAFYKKYSEDYRSFMKSEGITLSRFDAEQPDDGSMELWAYLHVGVPVFSTDLWSLPKATAEKTAKDSTATAMKKDRQASGNGKGDPKVSEQETAQLAWSDKALAGQGFIPWKPYRHPTLGDVEIGGFVPYMASTPPREKADSLLAAEVKWIVKMAGELPSLKIREIQVTPRGGGVYFLEVWVENTAYLPFPTAMGKRNKQPAPAILVLEAKGAEFLEGYPRTPVEEVRGLSVKKYSWLIRSESPVPVKISLESKAAGNDQKTVKLGGKP